MVKITPAAADSPAEPVVCTMLFSRIVERPKARRILIERTAIGMEAETVRPARKPTYTETAPNRIPNNEPSKTARKLNSRTFSSASTYGRNSAGGAVELQGFVATLFLPCCPAESQCCCAPDKALQSGQVSITRLDRQGAIRHSRASVSVGYPGHPSSDERPVWRPVVRSTFA